MPPILLGGLVMVYLEAPVLLLYDAMLFLDHGVKVLILVWTFRKGEWLHRKARPALTLDAKAEAELHTAPRLW